MHACACLCVYITCVSVGSIQVDKVNVFVLVAPIDVIVDVVQRQASGLGDLIRHNGFSVGTVHRHFFDDIFSTV